MTLTHLMFSTFDIKKDIMKRIFQFVPLLFLLFLFACNGVTPTPDEPVDKQTNYFYSEYQNPIAIFPTYKYLGCENIVTTKAHREYYVWKEHRENKYILITVLKPNGSNSFSKDIKWIDKEIAIYSSGNIAAFNFLHIRPRGVIYKLDGDIPDCVIVAQEFYLDKNRKEAIYKTLIVPDKMCTEISEPVIEELNRVANMQ